MGYIPDDAVYIGRGSKWGNPFIIGEHGTRSEVIEMYREYLYSRGLLHSVKEELRGKDLVCYCSPNKCHGDILLDIANNDTLFDW